MEAIVIQHGDAVDSSVNSQRPLSEEGKRQFIQFAQFLQLIEWKPDTIIHSGILRAYESAAIVAEKFQCQLIEHTSIKPNDNPDEIIQYLLTKKGNIVIVTHKPFIDVLVSRVIATSQTGLITITNASPVFLYSDGDTLLCKAYIHENIVRRIIQSFSTLQSKG